MAIDWSLHGDPSDWERRVGDLRCCEICGRLEEKLVADHCHETRVMRGLLCNQCNLGLGLFYDRPERLRAAANYVEKYGLHPTQNTNRQ